MRSLFILYAIIALTQHAESARVLGLFPHTGRSHQMVFEPLLRRLAERGHHVTVVSFFPLKNPPANYTDVSLEGLAGLGVETYDLVHAENGNSILKYLGVEHVFKQISEFSVLSEMALNVCSKLVEFPPLAEALKMEYDVVLVENFNSDCMLGLAHVYGIKAPVVALLSCGLMHWSADRIGVTDNPSHVPVISSSLTTKMNFLERLENTFLNIYFKLWFRYNIQLKEKEIIEKRLERKIPDLQELAKKYSLVLVNVFHSLHGPKPLLPGVVEVGGMHLDHSRKVIPNYIQRFLNESEQGVVLFSFGSLIKTASLPKHKEEIIVNALSKLKQRVIWKYEDSDEEGTLAGNILKVKWLPQFELLQHKKVIAFVCHGGLLGMTEAVSAGKPMLVVPFFGDQSFNAAAASSVGLATVMSYTDMTEKTLYDALQKVLSAEMRLSARRVSKIWRDRQNDPLDTAVYWTERVMRWGLLDPLHSSSRDLPFYQYILLDVLAAFIVVIIALILILRYSLIVLLHFVNGSIGTKEKLH